MKLKNTCPLKVNIHPRIKDSFMISGKDIERRFYLYKFWTPEDWYDIEDYDRDAIPKDMHIYNPFSKSKQYIKAGRYPGLLFKISKSDAFRGTYTTFRESFHIYPKHGIIYLPYAILLIPETFEIYDAYMATVTTSYRLSYSRFLHNKPEMANPRFKIKLNL